MEKDINRILEDREKKDLLIKKYLEDYNVISLKANIVGIDKNVFESYFLISYFEKIIDKEIPRFLKKERFETFDGSYILYLYSKDINVNLKEKTIEIEEKEDLGRLIDIDVYLNDGGSVKRSKLRKCLICDNDAFVCNRLKNHSNEELFQKMDQMIENKISEDIYKAINEAMELELALPYKFGCVCLNDSGSHQDMDANIMRKAKETIIPYFVKMFKCGYNVCNLDEVFRKIRQIGLDAELKMFKSTNGVNCYKGLIFILGLLVASIGYSIKFQRCNFNSIFENIKVMTRNLDNELNDLCTNGLKAYSEYKLKGARHEAMSGLVNVYNNYIVLEDLKEESLERNLIKIISEIDDTVMYTRCRGIKKYLEVKEMIKNINSKEELIKVNKYCIQENISVGGACDILIAVIFLKKISEKIKFNGDNYA